jgi:hypothetical protein
MYVVPRSLPVLYIRRPLSIGSRAGELPRTGLKRSSENAPSCPFGAFGLSEVIVEAMTHGDFLSVATVAAVLTVVLVLAVLSSLVFLWTDDFPGRRSVALFWMCLAVTWLLAIVAGVAIQSSIRFT